MPLFRRKPKPPPEPSTPIPAGEEVVRATTATLLYGKSTVPGALFLTDRRLLFEAKKGDARYLIVPFVEVQSSGLYPAPGGTMDMPASRRQCLFVETTNGEQVWWDFGEQDEREWLTLVQERADAARAPADEDS